MQMAQVELPYLASRKWLESEILAGNLTDDRNQVLAVDIDELGEEMRKRVESILTQVTFLESGRVRVLDAGVDPDVAFGPDPDSLVAMDEPVVGAIGELPELSEPTDSIEAVVAAWEGWLDCYHQEAFYAIEELNADPPATGWDRDSDAERKWGVSRVHFGHGVRAEISPSDGGGAMQNALASWAWERELHETFMRSSMEAAQEACGPSRAEAEKWVAELKPEDLAERGLELAKNIYITAKAHDTARKKRFPGFEDEMRRWALERGSERLRLGIEDGYRMNSRYLTERLAQEAPGFYAMDNFVTEDWSSLANSPTERALRLRRRVQAAVDKLAPETAYGKPAVEIHIIHRPPPQIYRPEMIESDGRMLQSVYPEKSGWPWHRAGDLIVGDGPRPFEAIVVEDWLGRFNLIGAVGSADGDGPRGIWAIPEIEHFREDGSVEPQDPDAKPPPAAKRKPPENSGDDDIPF
jgi:hypothetical protein